MSHIVFWISILGWGVGLTSFTLFAIRAQQERLSWLKPAALFSLSGICYLILQQVIFYLFTVMKIPYGYLSIDLPIFGFIGSFLLSIYYLFYFWMIIKATPIKTKKIHIVFLTVLVFLLNSGGFFHYGHTLFFPNLRRPLWTWNLLSFSQLLLFFFAGVLPSIMAVIKILREKNALWKNQIFIISVITILFSPVYLISYLKFGRDPYNYSDSEIYYFFFLIGLIFVIFSIISIFFNTGAIKKYLFPLPKSLPLSLQKELSLSSRETEVINLLLTGHRPAQISNKLFISIRTVNAHIQNIYKKLDVSGRPALIKKIQEYNYTG